MRELLRKDNKLKHHLTLHPNNLNGRYGCMITFQKGEIKNEIRYKLDVEYLKNTNTSTLYRIGRAQDLFINDKAPDNFMDQLAFETSKIIYPLEIGFLNDGSINHIQNFDEITSRWLQAKKKIKEYYKGELVDKYLNLINNTLKFEEKLMRKLTKDWFLYMYFKPLSKDIYTEKYFQFPTAGKALPVNYEITQKIEERSDAEDILIKIEGKIKDDRCALDLEQELDYPYFKSIDINEKDLEGNCAITYTLNKNNRIIEGIEAEFYTEYLEPKRIEIKMFLLEYLVNKNKFDDEQNG